MSNVTPQLTKLVDKASQELLEDKPRTHLGFSVLGNRCIRQVWYDFRWVYRVEHGGRMLRLFQRGHGEEARIARWLRAAGFVVQLEDPQTGKQFRASYCGNHVGGSSDGTVSGPELPEGSGLLECKTHSEKSFKDVESKGVALSKAQHYAQMQCYMGSFNLPWALYVAVNKNTDAIYYEVVHFKPEVFEQYMVRARHILEARQPPPRITSDPAWWECKFCDYRETCWKDRPYQKNCRSCAFAEPIIDEPGANWYCRKWKSTLPKDFIPKGCDQHEDAK